MRGKVLIVAGSDSGGGAGIQADLKTVTVLGAHGATAVTALTAQNTLGVQGILPVPPAFVALQMRAVLEDIGADAVKTGMLHDAAIVVAVADVLRDRKLPLVVDPVRMAKGGAELLDRAAQEALLEMLVPLATLVTPNAPEAAEMAGTPVEDRDGMRRAARAILDRGAGAVLVKGGHLPGDQVQDLLLTASGSERVFVSERIATRSTHGTGCTLASGIAAGLAQGMILEDAIERARAYLMEALRRAPLLGQGAGPLDHGFPAADYAGSWVRR